MKLTLVRKTLAGKSTIGELSVDGIHQCFTLEDTVRETKVFGETAIPSGTYNVIIDHSVHFNKDLPHVLDVKNFEGIRIHSGNAPKDTEGCILVGTQIGQDVIMNSKVAFDALFPKLQKAIAAKEP